MCCLMSSSDVSERNIWVVTTPSGSQYFVFPRGHIVAKELKSAGILGIPDQSTVFFFHFNDFFPPEFSSSCPTPARPSVISFHFFSPSELGRHPAVLRAQVTGGAPKKLTVCGTRVALPFGERQVTGPPGPA